MRCEVMKHYGFVKSFSQAGYYDTPHYRQRFNEIKYAIYAGRLIVRTSATWRCTYSQRIC